MATNKAAAAITSTWIRNRIDDLDITQRQLVWRTGIEQSRLSDLMTGKANVGDLEGIILRRELGAETYPWSALESLATETYAPVAKGRYLASLLEPASL